MTSARDRALEAKLFRGISDKRLVRLLGEAEDLRAEVGVFGYRRTRYEARPA
jgi:hypothetical protein